MNQSVLNTSPENQSLLAKRRNELLARQTPAERHIEKLLCELGEKHIPQKGFFTHGSHFIVDFYLPKRRKLCLEIDGEYHAQQLAYDVARDRFLTDVRGFRVRRITNRHALRMDAADLKAFINQ